MEESEDNLSADDISHIKSPNTRSKPKKRSLVERELETNLTARVTSPISIGDGCSTSRYGRARRLKNEVDTPESDKIIVKRHKSPKLEKSPKSTIQSPVYKMHASNSPIKVDLTKSESNFDNQIENIYTENISLSRFGSAEKKISPTKRYPKVYIRKDLIQTKDKDKETEETVVLIKNMFSPVKSKQKSSHDNRQRSNEKYGNKRRLSNNIDTSSVVKTLDFDEKKIKKETDKKVLPSDKKLSKNEIFELEAKSEYQIGDLAWARMGTYPFWPCIITREPTTGLFVKTKLFGRTVRNMLNVTFFGDNGRRSWIADSMLRPFLGQLEFETTRSQFTPEAKKKDPKLYMAFFISEKKMPQWIVSVEEAEMLLREPKRLRIDILNSMLMRVKSEKVTPKNEKSKKVTRADSDVSLSESLYDTLFSEDDTKGNDADRSRNKNKNKSLDVSEVVTACLDNMAAKTGITKIQRQSHMDRWLLKAKTKTPEKSQFKSQAANKTAPNSAKTNKLPKLNLTQKPYKFRNRNNESQKHDNLHSNSDEHDYGETSGNNSSLLTDKEIKNNETCDESRENIDLSTTANLNDNLIDDKHNTEVLSSNDDNLNLNSKSNLSEDIKSETCNSNSKSNECMENKNILKKIKQSIECEDDNVPSSSSADLSGISTSLEVSKLDAQASDIEMIDKTTDMSHSFLEITENCIDKSNQIDEGLSKDKHQSGPITSSPKSNLSNTIPGTNTESSDTIENIGEISHGNEDVNNANREIINIDKVKVTQNYLDKENENMVPTESQNDQNNHKIKDCAENDSKDNVIGNIPLNENITGMSVEINDNEFNKMEGNLMCDTESEKSSKKENESMSININMSQAQDQVCNTTSCTNNTNIEKEKQNNENENKSEKPSNNILHEELNVKNNACNGDVEEISKDNSNFFINKNFKKRNRNVKKSGHRNSLEPVKTQEICQSDDTNIVDDTTNNIINHKEYKTRSNKIHINDVNSCSDTEKSNINEIEKPSNVDSKDTARKKINLSLHKNNIIKDQRNKDLTKNEISNNEPKEVDQKGTESVISNHVYDDGNKQCLNQNDININCEKKTDKNNHVNNVDTETKLLNLDINVLSNNLAQEQKIVETYKEEPNICAENSVTSINNKQKLDFNNDTLISSEYNYKESINEKIESISSENKLIKDNNINTNSVSLHNIQKMYTETSSISEDSNSSTNKKKQNLDKRDKVKTNYEDPDFQKYLEFKQDIVLDEHPELSQEEITSYLYKTWLYEERNKSNKKSNEVDQTSLVSGTNYKALDKERGKIKLKRKKPGDLKLIKTVLPPTNTLPIVNGYHEENNTDTLVKITNENKIEPEKNITDSTQNKCINNQTTAIVSDLKPDKSPNDTKKHKIQVSETDNQVLNSDNDIVSMSPKENVKSLSPILQYNLRNGDETSDIIQTEESNTKTLVTEAEDTKTKLNNSTEIVTEAEDTKTKLNNSTETVSEDTKKENNSAPETISLKDNTKETENTEITPIIPENIESINNTKISKKREKKSIYEDPDFQKYLEFKQDSVMDEHPELSQEEIITYLYNTWLYEENNKSDKKKSDEVDQISLVKGANSTLDKDKGKRRLSRKKPYNLKDTEKKETISTINQFLTQNGYNHDFNKLLNTKEMELETFKSDDKIINSVQNESTQNKENVTSDEKHKDVMSDEKDKDVISTSDEKDKVKQDEMDLPSELSENSNTENSNISCSVSNCEETQSNKKTYKEEPFKDDDNLDNASVTSADSEMSLSRRRQRWKEKQIQEDKIKALGDAEFVRYLELRQDSVMDEHPELSEEEITNYLYKTWLYEENLKIDKKRINEIDQTSLVKGVDQEPNVKRIRKKFKVTKEDSQESFKISEVFEVSPKEKSKRSIVRPYYNEEFSDVEDEMGLFEIFRKKKKSTEPNADVADTKPQIEEINSVPETGEILNAEEIVPDEIDLVEMYFEQLTTPKPNVFKGLIRERVCEICEKVGNLVKCKSCHSMFHVDCVKNQTKTSEGQTPSKGRKKKRKYRRKPRNPEETFLDSESHSDEKAQDTLSDPNISIEYEREPIVADAEDFEAKASAKMKEILGDLDKIEYDYESSKVAIPWHRTEPGKCQIVDVQLQNKRQIEVVDTANFKCNDCEKYETPICFVCKSPVSPKDNVEYRQKCQVAHCNKYYHLKCLDHWPQTQFNGGESRYKKNKECFEAITCPRHVCHTCVSDDPRGCKTRFSGDKLARCVRCPATYHSFTKCLPAGSQILTGSQIICPRHYEHRPGKVPCHVNTGWCFICALGGTLICCEYCPTSFHAECLNIDPPEGGYMCEDCETGRLPLYGEMVWVKLGQYRWWPGIILHPSQIPHNILAVKHSQGEFVVRFFGQYDHYWVNRGRVFPFQEGDTGKISSQKSKIDAAFTMAVEHASRACEILKNAVQNDEESQDIASSLLPPHYVKLKVNKPVGSLCSRRLDLEESSLTQCECDPNDIEPCGPYSQCLNRMLLTECGPTCRAGDRCNNRAFEKRLYPKMEPYRTPHRGWGLKSLEDIRAGQFVVEYVGEVLDEAEFQRRMRRQHEVRDQNFYFLTLDKERMIDAGPKGNLARIGKLPSKPSINMFMNHSCEPNCETQKWTVLGDVRVGLFALYDIPANSELTFNYNLESVGIEKKQCMCGAKRCSGYIGAKPKQDDPQPKKNKVVVKKTQKKRKNVETSPASRKPKQRIGRPTKPKELTEIEKDLLIIKNATTSSDSEYSERLSIDSKDSKGIKRKRVGPSDNLTLCFKRVKTGDGVEFRID